MFRTLVVSREEVVGKETCSAIPHKQGLPCFCFAWSSAKEGTHSLEGRIEFPPRRIRRLMNPAFFGISCPVFSVSWLESSDEAATNESFALFSGGGGAAKTGVHNKIVNFLIHPTTSHGLRLTIQPTFTCLCVPSLFCAGILEYQ